MSAAQCIFPRRALCDGGGCAVLAGRRGVERLDGMFAKRERLAASGAEDCKHGAEDALACLEDALAGLAEQGAARRQARQYRGSFSGRRRWRFVARLAGKCPRIGKFHNAILHPHAQNLVPRHSGTRISVLPLLTSKLVRTLPCNLGSARLCDASTFIGKVVENCTVQVASPFGRCHLTVMRKAVSTYRV